MGELGVLFNPGMRHEQEEKLAKQMLREDEGAARKGRRSIDLESGVVVIGADDTPEAEPTPSATEAAAVNGTVAEAGPESRSAVDSASSMGADSSAEAESADYAQPTPVIKPGEPHVARHVSTAVPSGKARRRANGIGAGVPETVKPVGKSHRRGR